MRALPGVCVLIVALLSAVTAGAADSVKESIKGGELDLDLRYRSEFVQQDGFDKNANANTLRLRLGWTTDKWHGFYAAAIFDGNFSIGNERFNSTSNGRAEYPVVADPEDQQLNQAFIAYSGARELNLLFGRQTLNLDNQRFIGSVAFRQLEQRFDNVRVNIKPFDTSESEALKTLKIDYMYADRVYRVFGEHNPNKNAAEQDLDAHFVNVSAKAKWYRLAAYYYATRFHDQPSDAPLNLSLTSNQVMGVRLTGDPQLSDALKVPFQVEYANQSDYQNAPGSYSVPYVLAEAGLAAKQVTGKIGFELLGSDSGNRAFQTPLATLHKFNGWADVFLNTPAAGLQDIYVLVQGKVRKVNLLAVFHNFTADSGDADYGNEVDLRAWTKIDIYHIEVKYADYRTASDSPRGPSDPQAAGDKRIVWLTLGLAL